MEWIPVSKRLPNEERKIYLVSTDSGYMCSCRWTDDIYGLGVNEFTTEWGWCILDRPQYSKIVAWMDIEPYKGE